MESEAPPASPPTDAAKTVVLNINDDEAIRYVLSRMLKSGGFTVLEASTGSEGLEMASRRPDIILLDVQLPDLHGYDVCRALKADPTTKSIPVLMISATSVRGSDKTGGLESGADGYLVHPIAPAALVAAVNALLPGRR